ncbi:hypothetical protein AB0O91_30190 [Kitasatospora sp. NPDC089797]|uniref:hypothetical protein n=1 Tax=Kitasatospora sp. NPDC089797 TaxID=3155298 RepID=UPI00341E7B51
MTRTPVPLPPAVANLLSLSGRAREIPMDDAGLPDNWAPAVTASVLDLLTTAETGTRKLSHTGSGRTDLYIGRDGDNAYYVRIAAGNHTVPRPATDKTAVFTLAGTALLEAYTDTAHIEADDPQYVREFRPGSIHFVFPGTPLTVELSPDACQLVVSRGPMTPFGTELDEGAHANASKTAASLLAALDTHRATQAPHDQSQS